MNCRFCQPKKEDYNKIIRETENFFIIPTLGQFVEGYLLIIPKKHYTCFGALPDELLKEYHFLKKEIEKIYGKIYQKPIYFEHGPANNIRGGCCVDHAHMHIVPKNIDIIPELKKYFDVKKIKQIKELRNKYKKQRPYLFFENIKGDMFACNANPVPSQYIRQIIASKLDLYDKWDWRQYPFLDKIKKCQKKLTKVYHNGLKTPRN